MFRNFEKNHTGYFANLIYSRNITAVTAACLMMKKSVFEEINGFDEKFAVAFNDIDLCMRMSCSALLPTTIKPLLGLNGSSEAFQVGDSSLNLANEVHWW